MLLAVMMIIIVIRNVIKYLMNLVILGSDAIYQMENSVIDHVINNAIGIKVSDSVSSVMVMLMFSVGVIIRGSSVIVSSQLSFSSELRGIVLMINVNIRVCLVLFRLCLERGSIVDMIREKKIVRIMVGVIRFIFYYLDLHQEPWRLRPVE